MEKEINIAEILKDKPQGTKLYSPIFGELSLDETIINDGELVIFTYDKHSQSQVFLKDGSYSQDGEVMLFPSKEMRDWSKFEWKKGDVLVSNDGLAKCLFDSWHNEDYTEIKVKHYLYHSNKRENYLLENSPLTKYFSKADNHTALCYINTVEERLGGKLNMEILEIEDIKPKWTPKPFDKVLVRNGKGHNWTADFYSFTAHRFISGEERFVCVGGGYDMCIPYNEKTAHLIGTTDDYEED